MVPKTGGEDWDWSEGGRGVAQTDCEGNDLLRDIVKRITLYCLWLWCVSTSALTGSDYSEGLHQEKKTSHWRRYLVLQFVWARREIYLQLDRPETHT